MAQKDSIRTLEGLGYVSAFMVAAGSLVKSPSMRLIGVTGIFFGIVVLVRLIVTLVRQGGQAAS